MINKNPKYG